MLNPLAFTYVGETDDGSRIYFHDSVAGELTDAYVTNMETSVSVTNGQTSISFSAAAGADYYNKMAEHFGGDKVTVGILSVRADEAYEAGMLRPALLEGTNYVLDDEGLYASPMYGMVNFYGNTQNMEPG